VPLNPLLGTIGLALAEAWPALGGARGRVGGIWTFATSMRGSSLYLPVEVGRALLSIGDTHFRSGAYGEGHVRHRD